MNEEQCGNRSRLRFRSASTSFFLLLLNFTKCFQYMKAEPLPLAPSRLFIGNEGIWLICSSPRRAVASTWSNLARPSELVTSCLSYLGAQTSQRLAWASQGSKKLQNDPFSLPLEYFLHSLLKRRKTIRIAQQLVSRNTTWLTRIKTLANDHPQKKLGSDSYPFLLIFYWKWKR